MTFYMLVFVRQIVVIFFFLLIISIQNELTNNPSNIHTITKKPNIKRHNGLCNTYKNLDFKGKCVI